MTYTILTPRKSLNKAFLKVKPNRSEIDRFKLHLSALLDQINEDESEEFHKNIIADFLKNTYYAPDFYINTKGRNDLVIHNGKNSKSSVGLIVEAKSPSNKAQMPTTEKINTKALQELVLYFLRERISQGNAEVKHLIITNIHEWYIFDARLFERLFAENKKLVSKFKAFEAGTLSATHTDYFYQEIAKAEIEAVEREISFSYFKLDDYEKPLKSVKEDDNSLIVLFKLLSPEHILKLPFANDSNSLDKSFYNELLYIMGLEEFQEKGKKLIQRKPEKDRIYGTLLESVISKLESRGELHRLDNPQEYGKDTEERLFNVGLQLVITWLNRILFLKLLEAQLLAYNQGDKTYAFLNLQRIGNFNKLADLFFNVLAVPTDERKATFQEAFKKVPYLNSSLFEANELENRALHIDTLDASELIPISKGTVLKDDNGKRLSGELPILAYLFKFLEAYDFSSEGSEEIQEENKKLINASVLGLIFEKINGYKDGSFFTPGFITMYMCRDTIRRAVVEKFNTYYRWSCKDFSELREDLHQEIKQSELGRKAVRAQANHLINELKICDPAVGSGHFLVSALNELIAIKHELSILSDRSGEPISDYQISIENDELIITQLDGRLFSYQPTNSKSQILQETLFHEKQVLIENCLFGVDINPNSVKICRLRLWIELLKSAFYKEAEGGMRELETLPNIDINIKTGNSLISRFDLEEDLSTALRKSKWDIATYRNAVDTYRNAQSKEEKREMERLINSIKSDFRTEISKNDPKIKKKAKLAGELYNLTMQQGLFEMSATEQKKRKKLTDKIESELNQLETEIEEIKSNAIYQNAFEWRFEFPEVLNNDGDFVGFDVVIGNPPYIRQEEFSSIKPYLLEKYPETGAGTADLFVYFVELSIRVLSKDGEFAFIIPNKWMRAGYGRKLREFISRHKINQLIDFGDLPVFQEATTYPNIIQLKKSFGDKIFNACNLSTLDFESNLKAHVEANQIQVNVKELSADGWTLSDTKVQRLLSKLKSKGMPLGEYVNGKIYRGVLTGLNEAFVIDAATKDRLMTEDPNSVDVIKHFLAGRDIKRYQNPITNKFLIFTRRGINIEAYPAILSYLIRFKDRLQPKPKDFSGNWPGRKPGSYKWYEIQDSVEYFAEFEKKKVMLPDISLRSEALYDDSGLYCVNTAYVIPDLTKSDLGILNSKLTLFFYSNLSQTIRGGYFRFIRQYLAQIPMIRTNKLELVVNKIITIKKENPLADTTDLEQEIDQLVYELYGLSEEEIKIVEGE
ncbi:MAG: Eco57I restriction-modification methylase domain-containing protein [Cyclobacteriaceae bacterium]|nr:Eco57I restriction-modification methylase domain-containing protein [Cyclobacteriaceae bacterium]MCH8514787.1 Eco57I restriction-modification methylase domain-containing protein [Cyclobacteriaceae bacterium]